MTARLLLLSALLGPLIALLAVQGLSTRTTGRSATPAGGERGPLASAGPILVWDGDRMISRRAPPRTIALSFDDGPDPRWTPRIAATLRRLGVPATFFVVGSQVVRHPGTVRRLKAEGFELGNHTFTHADLAAMPAWERNLQLGLTENAVAGSVGVRPRLVRPPYSSTPPGVTTAQERALAQVVRRGYVVALADLDARDWQGGVGVEAIVRAMTPRSNDGGIVLLHDGGGDRSQTVAALERVVPQLRARGFRFVRVSELAGLSAYQAELAASDWGRLKGRLLLATLGVARWATTALAALLVAAALLFLARIALLAAFARQHVRLIRSRGADVSFAPPVSIVVPAFNEAVGIERAVRSLAASDYPEFEVIVIDDGSTDGTADVLDRLALPRVRVIRQPNRGKPAALNRGIAAARHDIIAMVDADTVFEVETLARLVQPLQEAGVGGVSGNTKVGNRRRLLGRWQHIEYVMGFNLDRRLYDVLQCMPTVPGAIGAFRRKALADAGGVSAATLAEDTDLTLALGRGGWRVVYVEDARAWTEAPSSLRALWRQRFRWSYGTLQAVWKHRAAIWRRGEGKIGRRGLPYLLLFQIGLPLLAPLIDLFSVYGLVFLDAGAVLLFFAAFTGLQLALGWYAFRLDRESPRVLWSMPLQQFVYRQLMYVVVIESVASAIRGTHLRWRPSDRSGEIEVPS